MHRINMAFAEGVPSLFIIQTPFQAMCAISAIRQLKIYDYDFSLHLHKKTENRNKQTIELVERYGVKYKIVNTRPIKVLERLSLLIDQKGNYNRVFLGTHLYQDGYYYALKELKRDGNLVLLDDGVATVSLLKKGYKITGISFIYMLWNKIVSHVRGVKNNNLFTVYKGITNPEWNISFNDISMLRENRTITEEGEVFFIGTNNSLFVDKYGVKEGEFKKLLDVVFTKIISDNPNYSIIYIPHGRDESVFAKDMCERMSIQYKPLTINIENYLLSLKNVPHAIYGFTSSALYNIKMLYPDTRVTNFLANILYEKEQSFLDISLYYEQQGIPYIRL